MKVTVWKAIDVECECECDVNIDDMIAEFGDRVDESAADYWRRMLPAVDCMSRILARISDDTIQSVQAEHREIIKQRLTEQAERW